MHRTKRTVQQVTAWLLSLLLGFLGCAYPFTALAGSAYLPPKVTVIDNEAYFGDRSITEAYLPNGIKTIGSKAFANTGLTTVVLPDSLTSIAKDAFDGCPSGLTAHVVTGSYAETWCRSNNIRYAAAEVYSGICLLERAAAEIIVPEEGGDYYVSLTDNAECYTSLSEQVDWLKTAVIEDKLLISVSRNHQEAKRSAVVTIRCGHASSRPITVRQDAALPPPTITLTYNSRQIADGAVLDTFAGGDAHTLTLKLKTTNAHRLSVTLTDKNNMPMITAIGLPYLDKVVDTLTVTLPAGTPAGSYKLTAAAQRLDADTGELISSTVTTALLTVYRSPTLTNVSAEYKASKYYTNLMAVKLTGDGATDILAVAKSQVGYHEGALNGSSSATDNLTEYGRWLGSRNVAWCGSFVSWCANLAGITCVTKTGMAAPGIMFQKAGSGHMYSFRTYEEVKAKASTTVEFMKDPTRCTYVDRETFVPQKGDFIFVGNSTYSFSHVGMVSHVANGRVYFYDGNNGNNNVALSNHLLTNTNITMYARPNY